MTVISFVSSKGGAGKTTSAILLATALARKHSVIVIDADPSLNLNRWANLSPESVEHIGVWAQADEYAILDAIYKARREADYVIVDTKGGISRLNSFVIGESDLVILASGEKVLEKHEAELTARDIVLESRALRKDIPFMVLLTRVKGGTKASLAGEANSGFRNKYDVFDVEIPDWIAFETMHEKGGTLWDYRTSEVSNLKGAIHVAEMFALNVEAAIEWLKDTNPYFEEESNYG